MIKPNELKRALTPFVMSLACGLSTWACQTERVGGPADDNDNGNDPPAVAAVVVTPDVATLVSLGETAQLVADPVDAAGNSISDQAISWTSSDEAVATVDASGIVTAIDNGTVTIVATVGDIEGSASLTMEQAIATITVTPGTWTVYPTGESVQLSASAADANGNPIAGVVFAWSTSDDQIATVDDTGLVTAVADGAVAVSATVDATSGVATVEVGYSCFADLPELVLEPNGTESITTGGRDLTRYRLTIANHADLPAELFSAAPDLAPCGLNARASRTWVDIYAGDGSRIYGFCGFSDSSGLTSLWFARPTADGPPASGVEVRLNDRRCNQTHTSNLLMLDP